MNLFLRADSSATVGAGHVMRCLALGQAWADRGGTVVFATPDAGSPLFDRLRADDAIEVVALTPADAADGDQTAAEALGHRADWVALDGYGFDDRYQGRLKSAGLRLLVLDDFGHAQHHCADLVLNQNLHARSASYGHRPTDLLLGPRHALLRREFSAWREHLREIPASASKILVTLGGGDTGTAVATVVGAIAGLDRARLRVRCLAGPLATEAPGLRGLAWASELELSFETAAADMPELMAWADVAVSAGGSTSWELAFMGLPTVSVAHNPHQERIALSLEEAGTALYAGPVESLQPRELTTLLAGLLDDAERRAAMSARGRRLVDGRGAERVVRELEGRLVAEAS